MDFIDAFGIEQLLHNTLLDSQESKQTGACGWDPTHGGLMVAKIGGDIWGWDGSRSLLAPLGGRSGESLASRRGQNKRGVHGSAIDPVHLGVISFKCAHVATGCLIVPQFPTKVDCGESRHLCDDTVCPDPVCKLSKDRVPGPPGP